jgi:hypothetical protein
MVGRDPNGAATVTASWLAPCRRRKRTPALSAGSSTYPNPATVLDEAGCCEGQGELTWHNGTGTGTGISHYRRITEFTVMIRPASGLIAVGERVGPALQTAGVR